MTRFSIIRIAAFAAFAAFVVWCAPCDAGPVRVKINGVLQTLSYDSGAPVPIEVTPTTTLINVYAESSPSTVDIGPITLTGESDSGVDSRIGVIIGMQSVP